MTTLNPYQPAERPDIHSASNEYAQRFAGDAGQWMLNVQEAAVLRMMASFPAPAQVLDIGGGHGQVAKPLVEQGHNVTVTGSAPEGGLRIRHLVDRSLCRFQVSDLLNLPFADRTFDVVTCFRIVTHVTNWQRLLAELTRVARVAVLMDYPSARSVNALTPLLFPLKRRVEGNTRTYHLFQEEELLRELRRHGFSLSERYSQFFFPMVIHRKLSRPQISSGLEWMADQLTLSQRWGSPVILKVVRERE